MNVRRENGSQNTEHLIWSLKLETSDIGRGSRIVDPMGPPPPSSHTGRGVLPLFQRFWSWVEPGIVGVYPATYAQ